MLLLPIGFGAILCNIPLSSAVGDEGFLTILYNAGLFPIVITLIAGIIAPISVALIGSLMFGNLIRACGVLTILSNVAGQLGSVAAGSLILALAPAVLAAM